MYSAGIIVDSGAEADLGLVILLLLAASGKN